MNNIVMLQSSQQLQLGLDILLPVDYLAKATFFDDFDCGAFECLDMEHLLDLGVAALAQDGAKEPLLDDFVVLARWLLFVIFQV